MPERTILAGLAIGLIAGVVARLMPPANGPGGGMTHILIGMAGALAAEAAVQVVGWAPVAGWREYGAALLGAAVLLVLYRLMIACRID